jgi:hypothetical protein
MNLQPHTKSQIAWLPLIHPNPNVTKQTCHPEIAQRLVHMLNMDLPLQCYENEMVVTKMGVPYIYAQKITRIHAGWTTRTVDIGIYTAEPKRPSVDFENLDWVLTDQRSIVFHAVEIGYHPCMNEQLTLNSYFDKEFCYAVAHSRLTGSDTEHTFKGFTRSYRVFDYCPSSTTGDIDVLVTNTSDRSAVVRLRKGGLKERHEINQ